MDAIQIPEMNIAPLLPLIVVVATAIIVLMLDIFVSEKRSLGWVSLIGVVLAGAIAIVQRGQETFSPQFMDVAMVDGYAHFFNLVFVATGALSILVALGYLGKMGLQSGAYYGLMLLSLSGMMVMAMGTDLMVIFLGLEIMSIALYIMTAINRNSIRSGEAGLKYFLLGAFASGIFLYGIAFVYGATGSINLAVIGVLLGNNPIKDPLALLGLGMLLVGFGFKIAIAPFQWWTPDVYSGAPTSVTTFMSVGAKAAGFAALIRVLMMAFYPVFAVDWQIMLAALAILTMLIGNLAALAQKDVKRMLAYSSIAHAGYILVGVASASAAGVAAALFYLMTYAFTNIGAFAVVGILEKRNEVGTSLSDYAGLGRRNPWLAAAMAIFLFSLTGFPPLAGFWGKVYLFTAAVSSGLSWLAVVAVINSGIAAFYYLGVIVQMYLKPVDEESGETTGIKFAPATTLALVLATLGTVAIGLYPSPVVQMAFGIFQ